MESVRRVCFGYTSARLLGGLLLLFLALFSAVGVRVAEATPVDDYVGYDVEASTQTGGSGSLPANWNVTLNAATLADFGGDDPENYLVGEESGLLLAATSPLSSPAAPALHYLRYEIAGAAEGVGSASGGKFPKAARHIKRRWHLSNALGSVVVDSLRPTSLLVPSGMHASTPAEDPGAQSHFICYRVKLAKGVTSDQAPRSRVVSARAKLLPSLQTYRRDALDDCAESADGEASFGGSPAQGMCLFDLRKIAELCTPAAISDVEPPRVTSAPTGLSSNPSVTQSLLCYQPRLAGKWTSSLAAEVVGADVGAAVPKQRKHVRRSKSQGTQIHTQPTNPFSAPLEVDTSKRRLVCLPTDVTSISALTCGNNAIDAAESCDGSLLGSATCTTQGFVGGTLACGADCSFDTSACLEPTPTFTVTSTPTVTPSATPTFTPTHTPPFAGLRLEADVTDPIALNYVAKSHIYPEDPTSLYLTLRGGGISVYDVSNPAAPVLRARWNTSEDVEGQDRLGDLLVVVARVGKLLTFDVSNPNAVVPLGEVVLDTDPTLYEDVVAELLLLAGNGPFGALHTKLDVGLDGRTYAFVTATATGELISVDVTDPAHPVQVGALNTDVEFIEGISIKDHYAFVGGFGSSNVFRAIDLTDPANMTIMHTLASPLYRQMVSEKKAEHPNLLFVALWDDIGGLGIFDVSNPAAFTEVATYTRPELAQSNRVRVQGDLAFLPLEQEPGGLAALDVSNAALPRFLGLARGVGSVEQPYALELNNDYVYLFGSLSKSMAVLHMERAQPAVHYSAWKFGPDTTLASLAAGGLPATNGQGRLLFLDPANTGSTGTAATTSKGTTAGIGHLTIAPGSAWTTTNGFWLEHGLSHTFYGTLSQYTLIWDVYVPAAEFTFNGCFSLALDLCDNIALYQLDRTNQNDADLFLKLGATFVNDNGFVGKEGDDLYGGSLGGYAQGIYPDTWHRVAIVVDLRAATGHAKVYIDGAPVLAPAQIDYELFAAVAEGDPTAAGLLSPNGDGFLLFADNNGEMQASIRLSSLLFVDRAYTAAEIAALGAPSAAGIPTP